jgi:dCMP deaminase|tara:strand:- start:2067 stop:2507 length:441 start_codon:yes stop_codon:yes gene_type:complete
MKPKFIKYFAKIAEETAKLSTAKKLQVGCVIVKDNRILSIGYNGTPAGWDNACEEVVPPNEWVDYEQLKTKPEVIHAERNALDKVAKSTESTDGAVLFVTHTPCIECAKSIYNTGITKVYYINDYDATQGCGKNFLEKAGVLVCPV